MFSIAHRYLLSPPRVPRSQTRHGENARPAQTYSVYTGISDHDCIIPSLPSQYGFHTSFMLSFITAIAVVLLSNKNDDDQGGGGHGALVLQ
eukprot:1138245-Pelagomonas_calceolata.AAC.17